MFRVRSHLVALFAFGGIVLLSALVAGVVLVRWFGCRSSDRPEAALITPQLLRAALDKACENQESRDFYGPEPYNIPRQLWDEAINPPPALPGQPPSSEKEVRNAKEVQKDVLSHRGELDNLCRDRAHVTDTDLMLLLEWHCEQTRLDASIAAVASGQAQDKIQNKIQNEIDDLFKRFPAKHHFSEERFNNLMVTYDLALATLPEGGLRANAQCTHITLRDAEDGAAKKALCVAHERRDESASHTRDYRDAGWVLDLEVNGTADSLNISTHRVLEIMKTAISDAKAKDVDVTWAQYCAGTSSHNEDRSRLDLSAFGKAGPPYPLR